ncbi:MAG TPA: 23S rRNA (uracil(1939)-C(5))-methyltransferase RlmD [Candidatus Angelobacter sp.]|nr:23S rRNA (uracil(1939)-C(5))-methyltransferase RlmD [Candidatus Angelobacter sp.]
MNPTIETLTIEKMIYGGDGLSHLPSGKAVFVPFVLPSEDVSVNLLEEKPGFARAALSEVLKPSASRTAPQCPYFTSCGGCHYQHADYSAQLEIKSAVLRETLRRTAKFEWQDEIIVHSAEPWNYRNRTRLKVRGGVNFCAGYYRVSSHDLLAVEQCPVSSPAINRAIAQLWQMGRAERVPAGVQEIEFFADHDDSRLLIEVYGELNKAAAQALLEEMHAKLPAVVGCAFFSTAQTSTPATVTVGEPSLHYAAGERTFQVSAGSFFQINRFLINDLVRTVTGDSHGKLALDLYAGVGLFANHLAARFERVQAAETSPASFGDLKKNGLRNVKVVAKTTEQFLETHKAKPELVVVDPPRAGLGDRTAKLLASLSAPAIAYLSCDPATLARDLRVLRESGYRVEAVHLFDLFPQTFHIECLVRLTL